MYFFVTELNKTLEAQLQNIQKEESDTLKKALLTRDCVKNALNQLKAFVLEYSFENEAEEIFFFKTQKPDLQSKYVYYKKIAKIESLRPVGSFEEQEKYLKECLQELTLFFNNHKDFYQYYRMESIHFDDKYFLRGKDVLIQKIKNADIEEKFCANYDYIVAKIIAYDQLEIYLKAELEKISVKMQNPHVEHIGILGKFRWTGDKIELEELTYSLADSGIINNGKCKVNQLAEALGAFFDMEIKSTIHRDLQDIKTRDNPTQFLDHLKTAIFRRIGKRP